MKEPNNQALRAARDELAGEVSRVAGCQAGSDRTRRLVDFILLREATLTTDRHAEGRLAGLEEAAYDPAHLPLLLSEHVITVLTCESEPDVIKDAVAIVLQAAAHLRATAKAGQS